MSFEEEVRRNREHYSYLRDKVGVGEGESFFAAIEEVIALLHVPENKTLLEHVRGLPSHPGGRQHTTSP